MPHYTYADLTKLLKHPLGRRAEHRSYYGTRKLVRDEKDKEVQEMRHGDVHG